MHGEGLDFNMFSIRALKKLKIFIEELQNKNDGHKEFMEFGNKFSFKAFYL